MSQTTLPPSEGLPDHSVRPTFRPLLSILIATKNRIPYCINAIQTILAYPDTDFQLVVHDNSDTEELKHHVETTIRDPRLTFAYVPPPFSSIQNFNAALELCQGEYLCLIGDDDAVCPNIFQVARWAAQHGLDSVCPKVFVDYYWPHAFAEGSAGYLAVPPCRPTIQVKDCRSVLPALLEDGIIEYMRYDLPKLYHGLVRRGCMEEVKRRTGHYIGGLSADIYAAVTLSQVVRRHVVLGFPISISGACRVSGSVAGQNGGHAGRLDAAPHFRDRGPYIWEATVPKFYSVPTIWAETGLKAMKEIGAQPDDRSFNTARMVAKSLFATPVHWRHFMGKAEETLRADKDGLLAFRLRVLWHLATLAAATCARKVLNRTLFRLVRKPFARTGVETVGQAVQVLEPFFLRLDTRAILATFRGFGNDRPAA